MDTPPPINEEEVFEVAAALPADEQAAYLDAACDGRPELRARMERLLAAHGKCEFMQVEMREMSAEIEGQLARLKPEEEGEHIGPYKLLQQIGEAERCGRRRGRGRSRV